MMKAKKYNPQASLTITCAGSAGGVKTCTCSYVPWLAPSAREDKMVKLTQDFSHHLWLYRSKPLHELHVAAIKIHTATHLKRSNWKQLANC